MGVSGVPLFDNFVSYGFIYLKFFVVGGGIRARYSDSNFIC